MNFMIALIEFFSNVLKPHKIFKTVKIILKTVQQFQKI